MKKVFICEQFSVLEGKENTCKQEFLVESGEDLIKQLKTHLEFGSAHKEDREKRLLKSEDEFSDISGAEKMFKKAPEAKH